MSLGESKDFKIRNYKDAYNKHNTTQPSEHKYAMTQIDGISAATFGGGNEIRECKGISTSFWMTLRKEKEIKNGALRKKTSTSWLVVFFRPSWLNDKRQLDAALEGHKTFQQERNSKNV